MKKSVLSPLVLGLFLTLNFAPSAHSYTREQLNQSVGFLEGQMAKIQAQKVGTCPENYKNIFQGSGDKVRLSVFFGYENADDLVMDRYHARALEIAMQMPCEENLQSCGFKQIDRQGNQTVLSKVVNGKEVILSIYHSALTDSDSQNAVSTAQVTLRKNVKAQFNRALKRDQVVFYTGHSRHGGGPGLSGASIIEIGLDSIFKFGLRPMLATLAEPKSNLKILGLFSCESERYYRSAIEQIRPDLSLILSTQEIAEGETEQMIVGALNSILDNKCSAELKESLVADLTQKHKAIKYLLRK